MFLSGVFRLVCLSRHQHAVTSPPPPLPAPAHELPLPNRKFTILAQPPWVADMTQGFLRRPTQASVLFCSKARSRLIVQRLALERQYREEIHRGHLEDKNRRKMNVASALACP